MHLPHLHPNKTKGPQEVLTRRQWYKSTRNILF